MTATAAVRDNDDRGEALARLDQTFTLAVLAGRAITLAQVLGVTRAVSRRVTHRSVLRAGVAAITAHSVWAGVRGLRRRTVRDPKLAWSDCAAQLVALLTEAASWGARAMPPEPRWSETFGVVVAGWLPFEAGIGGAQWVALTSWIATYLSTTGDRSPWRTGGSVRGQRINESAAQVAFTVVGETFARYLVTQARELDDARAEAVEQGERLATERERQRQHRVIHDSALQVFEAVAGGWELNDDVLIHRIEYETARLRAVLGERPMPDDEAYATLDAALHGLAGELALLGLEVDIRSDAATLATRADTIEALRGATHEALINVHKHAGVVRATVHVTRTDDGIELAIVDEGRGFDVATAPRGFGLAGSIEAPLREVGGRATVRSAPGEGTQVRLWVPE